jgi:hypothetical protein
MSKLRQWATTAMLLASSLALLVVETAPCPLTRLATG